MRLLRRGWVVLTAMLVMASLRVDFAQTRVPQDKQFQEAFEKEMVAGDLKAAIELYRQITVRPNVDRHLASEALWHMAECHQKLRDGAAATALYQRIVREFSEQPAAARARTRLGDTGSAKGVPTPVATPTPQGPVRIWADKSTDVSGRLSRDGRFLTFIDWTTYGMSVRDLATGEVRVIVPEGKSPLYPENPTPSHDGRQIAYVFDQALHIVPSTGGPSKVIFKDPRLGFIGDWTADGTSIVVTKALGGRQQEIGIVEITTGAYRRLTDERWISGFQTATSGPFAVYYSLIPDNPSRRELRTLSLKDGRVRTLLTGADDFSPVWSPKQDAVLFMSNRNGRLGLWSIPVRNGEAGGTPRMLHEISEDLWLLGVTPAGTAYFACAGGTMTTYVARVTWPEGNISEPTAVSTPKFLGALRPVFSPDSKLLATIFRPALPGVRPGWQTPAVTELATGRQWSFPSQLTIRDEVAWRGDGRSLIAISDESADAPWAFWRLSLPEGSMTRIGQARATGLVRLAGVTDTAVVYKRSQYVPTLAYYVEVLDLKSGDTRELYRSTDEMTDASLSPDGTQVAMTIRNASGTSIFLLRVGETTPRRLAVSNFTANGRPQTMWAPTQDAVILSGAINREQGIWRVPVNGDTPQRLKLNVTGAFEARLSPDLRMLAFSTRPERGREVWMLANAMSTPAASR